MTFRVTFVEMSAFEAILPLASGYIQAYACQDPEIRDSCEFEIYSAPVDCDREAVLGELIAKQSDVYALSCYIWNMRVVTWLLARLHERVPHAQFVLGGPQVMNHAADYVAPDQENIVVCNGEGEITLYHFLKQVRSAAPDLGAVPGLSYMRDGRVVTTPPAPRINDLTEVPSPFTTGVFEQGKYTTAILETNRGCPFRCSFCFWGAATNDKVHKFETDRILDDITWIAQNNFVSIFIADANWGMAPRDVEFTKHIVSCAERYGYPVMVSMAAAKNKPDRMAEITEILVRGGLLTTQPISLQSMSPQTLDMIDRSNIKPSTYTTLQQTLREKAISSYIELIWPLPGETLQSYKEGIGELCRSRADTIIVYPELLLHNTPIYRNREALGVVVESVPSDVAEAEVVVGTNWVDRKDYEEGAWFSYAVHALYNLRGLYYLANYLDRTGTSSFEETFSSATAFLKAHQGNEISRFFAESVAGLGNYDFHNGGVVAHLTLHSHRREFDEILAAFVRTQPWWQDGLARAAFELDLLARPYIYIDPVRMPEYEFERLGVRPAERSSVIVDLPSEIAALLHELDLFLDGDPAPTRLLLTHSRRRKLPFMKQKSLEHNASYCQGMILRLREILPTWTPVPIEMPVSG